MHNREEKLEFYEKCYTNKFENFGVFLRQFIPSNCLKKKWKTCLNI